MHDIIRDHSVYITDNQARDIAIGPSMPLTMQRGSWSLKEFSLVEEIYRGKASIVFKAIDIQSEIQVALKVYRKRKLSALGRYQVEREIHIHIAVDHEHIIKLYCAFEDEKNVYLVQELASSGDLFEELRRNGGLLREKYAVRDVLAPFLNSLCYLHNLDIIHRDIKPENILVTSTKMIKLADFGLGIDCSAERPVTRCGTLDYMAPEVLICPDKKHPEENKDKTFLVYGPAIDVWAVGILAFELLTGRPLFERDSRSETYDSIMYHEPLLPTALSPQAKSFIRDALNKNSATRVTVFELLQHPWIHQYARSRHLIVGGNYVPEQAPVASAQPVPRLGRSIVKLPSSKSFCAAQLSTVTSSHAADVSAPPGRQAPLAQVPLAQAPLATVLTRPSLYQSLDFCSRCNLRDPAVESIVTSQSSSFTSHHHSISPQSSANKLTTQLSSPKTLSPMPSSGILSGDASLGQGSFSNLKYNGNANINRIMQMDPASARSSASHGSFIYPACLDRSIFSSNGQFSIPLSARSSPQVVANVVRDLSGFETLSISSEDGHLPSLPSSRQASFNQVQLNRDHWATSATVGGNGSGGGANGIRSNKEGFLLSSTARGLIGMAQKVERKHV